jgi:hypothetical protein
MSTPPDVPKIASQIYALLQPLESDARKLAIAGALAMLGEQMMTTGTQKEDNAGGDDATEYPRKATQWMKQNGVTSEQLSHVFHDGEIIAATLPGSSKKEKTVATYILCGIGNILKTGEPKFEDAAARETCQRHSCFDLSNHSGIIRASRNLFTDSKDAGWTLTAPGLKQGADLVKQLAEG